MFRPTLLAITSRCLALASSVALTGCVTAGNLEKLETRLSERMQALENQSRSQLAGLRAELQEIQSRQDSLRGDLIQAFEQALEETKAAVQVALELELGPLRQQLHAMEDQRAAFQSKLEEFGTAHDLVREEVTQAFAQVQSRTQSALKEIGRTREALTRYAEQSAGAFERIVTGTDRLRARIADFHRGLMQSLVGAYHAEEAALRERLRAILQVRQELEVVAGPPEADSLQLTEQELLIKRAGSPHEAVE